MSGCWNRERCLRVAVRGGGHCFAGRSSTDGILIDVGPMNAVSVANGIATVGAGARLGEVYDALEAYAVAIAGGCGPSVGIAGLALGEVRMPAHAPSAAHMSHDAPSALALSWSGGKDSALALWVLAREHGIVPTVLITTVTDAYGRISIHGVRRSLLARQANGVGVPLIEIQIPPGCTNALYEQRMTEAFASEPLRSVEAVAFGDLFLEDIRSYREDRLAAARKRGCFPLWKRDTTALAREFVAAGFEAIIVCVDPAKLDRSFAGRRFDDRLLADLPAGVDPCGENGEFHTFVYGGPILPSPISVRIGETVERDGFVFTDLTAAGAQDS